MKRALGILRESVDTSTSWKSSSLEQTPHAVPGVTPSTPHIREPSNGVLPFSAPTIADESPDQSPIVVGKSDRLRVSPRATVRHSHFHSNGALE